MDDSSLPVGGQPAEDVLRFGYDGQLKAIAGIAVVNLLLTVATLGIYRFWAKTRLRRYFWGRIALDGERFEYSGTGKELFIGFLMVLLILVPLVLIFALADLFLPLDPLLLLVKQLAVFLAFWFLFNVAIFRARRYRLTRTRWRGLRFTQTGSSVGYAFTMMGWQLLVALTLGLAMPFYRTARQRYLTDNTRFGNHELRFLGQGKDLFVTWVATLLLWLPTVGLSYVWYRVREFNYFAGQTRFRGLRAEATLSARRVIWLVLRYGLVLILPIVVILVPTVELIGEFLATSEGAEPVATQVAVLQALNWVIIALVAILFVVGSIGMLLLLVHPLLAAVVESLCLKGRAEFDILVRARDEAPTHGEGLFDALDVGEF